MLKCQQINGNNDDFFGLEINTPKASACVMCILTRPIIVDSLRAVYTIISAENLLFNYLIESINN